MTTINLIGITFTLVLLVIAIGGCAGGPPSLPDAQSPNALLFAEKCSSCHALPHPKRHTAKQWQHYVALMEQRISERGLTALTTEERKNILSYLTNNSR